MIGTRMQLFYLQLTVGLIKTTSSAMDYESLTSKSFNFQVSVSDGASSDLQAIVIDIINVNEAPSFSQTAYTLSASEGAVSLSIFPQIVQFSLFSFKYHYRKLITMRIRFRFVWGCVCARVLVRAFVSANVQECVYM